MKEGRGKRKLIFFSREGRIEAVCRCERSLSLPLSLFLPLSLSFSLSLSLSPSLPLSLSLPDGTSFPMRIRSMVGLIPLYACLVLENDVIKKLPGFRKRLEWFLKNRPDLSKQVCNPRSTGIYNLFHT